MVITSATDDWFATAVDIAFKVNIAVIVHLIGETKIEAYIISQANDFQMSVDFRDFFDDLTHLIIDAGASICFKTVLGSP